MSGCAGVLGLFFLLVAGAGDEAVWKYFGPPLLIGLGIGVMLIVLNEWRRAVRGLR